FGSMKRRARSLVPHGVERSGFLGRLDPLVRERRDRQRVAEPAVVQRDFARRLAASEARLVGHADDALGLAVEAAERALAKQPALPALDDLLAGALIAVLSVLERTLEPHEPRAVD